MATAGTPWRRAAASHGRRSAGLTLVASMTVSRPARAAGRAALDGRGRRCRSPAGPRRRRRSRPASASDDRISSARNSRPASVDLPEPAAPTSTTTDGSGSAMRSRADDARPGPSGRRPVRTDGHDPTRTRPPSSGSAATCGCTTTRPSCRTRRAPSVVVPLFVLDPALLDGPCSPRRTGRGSCSRPLRLLREDLRGLGSRPRRPRRRPAGRRAGTRSRRSARATSTSRVTTPRTAGPATAAVVGGARGDRASPGTRSRGVLVHEPEEVVDRRRRGRSACTRRSAGPGSAARAPCRPSRAGPIAVPPAAGRRAIPSLGDLGLATGRPARPGAPARARRGGRASPARALAGPGRIDGYARDARPPRRRRTARRACPPTCTSGCCRRPRSSSARRPARARAGGPSSTSSSGASSTPMSCSTARPCGGTRSARDSTRSAVVRRRATALAAWRDGPDRLPGRRCRHAPAGAPRAGCTTARGWSRRRS